MATKKQRRTNQLKSKKQKKTKRTSVLALIVVATVGFLIIFFIALFDFIFPPHKGKETASRSREKIAVSLYFSDANERFLIPEKRFISKEQDVERQAMGIVKALIEGSKTKLVKTFPDNATVQSVKIDSSRTATVSFSKSLIDMHPGGSATEMATIYSLTNSLAGNISEIERVQILIEGKERSSLVGNIDIRRPFRLNKEIIATGT